MQIYVSKKSKSIFYPLEQEQLNGTFYPQEQEHPHHTSKSTLIFKSTSKSMWFAHFCNKRNLYGWHFECYALFKFQFHQMNFFCLLSIWYHFNKSILNCEWVNSTTRITHVLNRLIVGKYQKTPSLSQLDMQGVHTI